MYMWQSAGGGGGTLVWKGQSEPGAICYVMDIP